MFESPELNTSSSQYQMGLRWENIAAFVSFTYPIKTWVWRCPLRLCPQVLPPHVGANTKSGTTYMSGCFPDISSHKLTCGSEWNASRSETQNALSTILLRVSSNMHNPVRSCIFTPQLTKFFDKNPNNVRPLGLRVSGDVSGIGFSQKNYLVTSVPSTPPFSVSI